MTLRLAAGAADAGARAEARPLVIAETPRLLKDRPARGTRLRRDRLVTRIPVAGHVKRGVDGPREQFEILRPVVGFVTVLVVDGLAARQWTTEHLTHYQPMLVDIPHLQCVRVGRHQHHPVSACGADGAPAPAGIPRSAPPVAGQIPHGIPALQPEERGATRLESSSAATPAVDHHGGSIAPCKTAETAQ